MQNLLHILMICMVHDSGKKITVEDVKYVLSSHYQGTSYDPYASYGEKEQRGAFRSIGVNRTDFLSLIQMRPGMEKDCNISGMGCVCIQCI